MDFAMEMYSLRGSEDHFCSHSSDFQDPCQNFFDFIRIDKHEL